MTQILDSEAPDLSVLKSNARGQSETRCQTTGVITFADLEFCQRQLKGKASMQLYLVQHGAAKSGDEDPQRGLTEDGRRTVERLADFLTPLQLSLDRIEHSEKLRARQTAEILAERLRPHEGTREIRGMAPKDEVGAMRSRLQGESKNLMLVGHLPYLGRLVAELLGLERHHDAVQFQMGGLVRLDRHEAGHWVVYWMIMPELLTHR